MKRAMMAFIWAKMVYLVRCGNKEEVCYGLPNFRYSVDQDPATMDYLNIAQCTFGFGVVEEIEEAGRTEEEILFLTRLSCVPKLPGQFFSYDAISGTKKSRGRRYKKPQVDENTQKFLLMLHNSGRL